LRKFEEDAKIAVDKLQKSHEEDPQDENKKIKYYTSKEKYLLISKMTGKDSPAKVTAKKRVETAKKETQKKMVTNSIVDLESKTNPENVAKSLEEAGA
jgi:hypothetical protein